MSLWEQTCIWLKVVSCVLSLCVRSAGCLVRAWSRCRKLSGARQASHAASISILSYYQSTSHSKLFSIAPKLSYLLWSNSIEHILEFWNVWQTNRSRVDSAHITDSIIVMGDKVWFQLIPTQAWEPGQVGEAGRNSMGGVWMQEPGMGGGSRC